MRRFLSVVISSSRSNWPSVRSARRQALESLPGLRSALREHRIPGDDELVLRGLENAEHLPGPGELQGGIAVLPTAHLGRALRLLEEVREALDLGDVDATANGAHRIARGVALDEAALEYGSIAPARIANTVGHRPAPALDERQTDLPGRRLEIG